MLGRFQGQRVNAGPRERGEGCRSHCKRSAHAPSKNMPVSGPSKLAHTLQLAYGSLSTHVDNEQKVWAQTGGCSPACGSHKPLATPAAIARPWGPRISSSQVILHSIAQHSTATEGVTTKQVCSCACACVIV